MRELILTSSLFTGKAQDTLSLGRSDSLWTESTVEQDSTLDSQELDAIEDDFDEDEEAEAEAQAAESPTPVAPSKAAGASRSNNPTRLEGQPGTQQGPASNGVASPSSQVSPTPQPRSPLAPQQKADTRVSYEK